MIELWALIDCTMNQRMIECGMEWNTSWFVFFFFAVLHSFCSLQSLLSQGHIIIVVVVVVSITIVV